VGAPVSLTIEKVGCSVQDDQVATVFVNPYPNAAINASTANMCVSSNGLNIQRTFQPQAALIPGATYTWDFGPTATPSTATGYGPHQVYYTTLGTKVIQLIVDPNYTGSSCPDTSSISLNVVQCTGTIAGSVVTDDVPAEGFQGIQIALHKDVNTDGIADPGGFVTSAFTQANGGYVFVNVATGHYVLRQATQPGGYLNLFDGDISPDGDLVPNTNSANDTIPVTLTPNKNDLGNNFIETAQAGSITGSVFEDMDGDLELDSGEGIPGVTVELYLDVDIDGLPDDTIPLLTVITNVQGIYGFLPVDQGNYVIVEVQPIDYSNVMDIGSFATGDANDPSNTDPTDDMIPVAIAPGEADQNNRFIEDFGALPDCTLLVENTNDDDIGSLRYNIECAQDGDTIRFASNLAGDTIMLTTDMIMIDKNLVILSELAPRVNVSSEMSGVFGIALTYEVEFNNVDVISGPSGAPAAFDVSGDLILEDVKIMRNINLAPGVLLILNNGTVTIRGNVEIQD
jgi:hypothetical protein